MFGEYEKNNIMKTWYITDGGLLGFMRTGSIIPWDCDLDVCVVETSIGSFESKLKNISIPGMKMNGGFCHEKYHSRALGGNPDAPCLVAKTNNPEVVVIFREGQHAWFDARMVDLTTGAEIELYRQSSGEKCEDMETRTVEFDGVTSKIPGDPIAELIKHGVYGYDEEVDGFPMQTSVKARMTTWMATNSYQDFTEDDWMCKLCSIPESMNRSTCVSEDPEIEPFKYVFELETQGHKTIARPCRPKDSDANRDQTCTSIPNATELPDEVYLTRNSRFGAKDR
jgi:hypothetical protein